jgi:hypothetical protein
MSRMLFEEKSSVSCQCEDMYGIVAYGVVE